MLPLSTLYLYQPFSQKFQVSNTRTFSLSPWVTWMVIRCEVEAWKVGNTSNRAYTANILYFLEFFDRCAKVLQKNKLPFCFCFYFIAQKIELSTEGFMTSRIQSRWWVILANMVVSPHFGLPILSASGVPALTVPMRTCWWQPCFNVRGPPLSPCNLRN